MRTLTIIIPAVLLTGCLASRGTVTVEDTGPEAADTSEDIVDTGGADTGLPEDSDEVEPWIITGDLTIENSRDLEGLEGLAAINGDLTVRNVDSLPTLADLRQVRGMVAFEFTRLRDLDDLSSLEDVEGLRFRSNDDLEDISGLDGLLSLGRVEMTDNDSLEAFSAAVPGHLDVLLVVDNDALRDLGTLEGLVSATDILVTDNVGLCQTYAFTALAGLADGFYVIEDNEGACP